MHITRQMNHMKVTSASNTVYAHLATQGHCYRISQHGEVCSLKMWQRHGCRLINFKVNPICGCRLIISCTVKKVCFLQPPTAPPQGTIPDVVKKEKTQQQITHHRRKPETPNGVKSKWQEDTGSRRRIEDRQIAVTPKEKLIFCERCNWVRCTVFPTGTQMIL